MEREDAIKLIDQLKIDENLTDEKNFSYCITAEGFIEWIYGKGYFIAHESEFDNAFFDDEEAPPYIIVNKKT